jgi:serine/threonine protein kinase
MDYRQVLQTGTVLDGKYRIERVIGSGGFGITYEAFDIGLAAPVAIKEYYPSQFGVRDATYSVRPRTERDREIFDRLLSSFLREARTLNQFEHPAIVRVLSVFEAYGTAYMVMKYETGPSLKAWLADLVRLPTQSELDRLVPPLLDSLEMMHSADFLHRDIAPDNIIVRADGSPVLLDFGASRRVMGEMTGTLTGVVKKGYSPQEQYATDSRSQGPWTDIYALGATLYRCISGETPHEATERMLDDQLLPAVEAGAGRYRHEFLAAIDAAMVLRPKQRPASIAIWREMLYDGMLAAPSQPQSWPSVARTDAADHAAGGAETRHWDAAGASGSQPRSGPRSVPSQRHSGSSRPGPQSEPASLGYRSAPSDGSGVASSQSVPAPRRRNMSAIAMVVGAVAIIGGGGLVLAMRKDTPSQDQASRVLTDDTKRREAKKAADDAQRLQNEHLERLEREVAAARTEAERQRQVALEADRQRQAEESRRAETERQRQLALEAERQRELDEARRAEAERQRQQAEVEAERRRQVASEAERQRQAAAEAERQRSLAARPRQLAYSAPGAAATFPVAVQTNSRLIVAGGSDGGIRAWDVTNGTPREFSGTKHTDAISSIAVSPDDQQIVTGAWGGEIIVWSLNGTAQRFRAADAADSKTPGRRWVVATEFISPTRFVSVLSDGTAQTWDTRTPGAAVGEVRLNASGIKAADISRNGSTVATGTDAGGLTLFRASDGQQIRQLPAHRDWILALAFAWNVDLLGSGSADGIVRIQNTRGTGQPREIQAHSTAVRAITFSADGTRVATGGDDGTVTVWDTASGSQLATYKEHRNSVRSLTLSPDGQRLVSASEDGDVRVWYLDALVQASAPGATNTQR